MSLLEIVKKLIYTLISICLLMLVHLAEYIIDTLPRLSI